MITGRRERYLNEVRRQLFAPEADVERFVADLEAHFEAAEERGESEASVIAHLGTPEECVQAFMERVDLRYAGFWARVVAFCADVGIVILAFLPLAGLCGLAANWAERNDVVWAAFLAVAAPLAFAVVLGVVLYFPLLEGRFGKTPGKHLLGMRVRMDDGRPIGYLAAFLRRLSLYFEILVLDAIFVPFNDKKQRAFDMVAKTVVVYEPGTRPGARAFVLCVVAALLPAALLCGLALTLVTVAGG